MRSRQCWSLLPILASLVSDGIQTCECAPFLNYPDQVESHFAPHSLVFYPNQCQAPRHVTAGSLPVPRFPSSSKGAMLSFFLIAYCTREAATQYLQENKCLDSNYFLNAEIVPLYAVIFCYSLRLSPFAVLFTDKFQIFSPYPWLIRL